jgi:hypothetical protein
MKRLFFALFLSASVIAGFGQKSVDRLFDMYSDKDNLFTMHLSGNLLRFVVNSDNDDDESLPQEVTEIRLIAQKDDQVKIPDFYKMVMKNLDTEGYEEFMRIKSVDQNTILLVKSHGREFNEFLMVAGGEHNVVIQVKGSFSFKDAKKFSENIKKDHCKNLVCTVD